MERTCTLRIFRSIIATWPNFLLDTVYRFFCDPAHILHWDSLLTRLRVKYPGFFHQWTVLNDNARLCCWRRGRAPSSFWKNPTIWISMVADEFGKSQWKVWFTPVQVNEERPMTRIYFCKFLLEYEQWGVCIGDGISIVDKSWLVGISSLYY